MAGLVPAIHVLLSVKKTWMPAPSAGMTTITRPKQTPALRSGRFFIRSADVLQHRKRLDQPAVELREDAGEERNAGQHQQTAHDPFHVCKMGAEARQERGERLDRERGDDERDAEP